jgi:ABC-type phosphate transport system substrate-binding protein
MTRAGATVLSALATLVGAPASAAETTPSYKIVVNAANPQKTLSPANLKRIFLKKDTTWASGQTIAPVDQATTALCRKVFSKAVLGKDTAEVTAYWNQLIFSGRGLPPAMKASDGEVLSFVRDNPNAIGYVCGDAKIGEGVKVVTVTE